MPTIILFFAFLQAAAAQPLDQPIAPLSEFEEQLALAVAKVCANERSLSPYIETWMARAGRPGARRHRYSDCALIWQATRRFREPRARLDWLIGHSSCPLTDRERTDRERLGNCAWSRHLEPSSAEPLGWNEPVPWQGTPAQVWAEIREFCRRLVAGFRPPGGWPCERNPQTWGGYMDTDDAEEAGMIPVVCSGVANEGYLFRPLPEAAPRTTISEMGVERTAQRLEDEHHRLLDELAANPSPATRVLAQCVPQLVGLIEDRVPQTDAVILRREDVREMLLSFAVDVLRVQSTIV